MRIDEIKSSPARLKKMAAGIDALVGIEFELIVRDAVIEDGEPEPDYDTDEGVITRSWSELENDIRNFFVGDYNSRRDVDSTLARARRDFNSFAEDMWGTHVENEFEDWQQQQENPDDADKSDFRRAKFEDWFDKNEYRMLEKWSDDENLSMMMGWTDRYSVEWPNWTHHNDQVNNDSIAQSFAEYVNMDVGDNTSIGSSESYNMTDDSSINPYDTSTEAGIEFVSPPLSLDEMINHLHAVKRWAEDGNAYTNESCGLHINVSTSNFSQAKLDYIKLLIFSADQNVLEQFERTASVFAKSAKEEIQRRVKLPDFNITDVLTRMRQKLLFDASRLIHDENTYKYVSINVHYNRVEFRSPGGNWLDMEIDQVINTVVRYVVALNIAMDPNLYQKEYASKFYKLISPDNTDTTLALFSLLQTKTISSEQFKKRWAQMVAKTPYSDDTEKRHDIANRILNRKYNVTGPNGERFPSIYAASQNDAVAAAKRWAAENGITVDWTVKAD